MVREGNASFPSKRGDLMAGQEMNCPEPQMPLGEQLCEAIILSVGSRVARIQIFPRKRKRAFVKGKKGLLK